MNLHQVLVRPVITEKNTALADNGKYVFEVDREANKLQIAQAVSEIFKVTVVNVNTLWVVGKTRRFAQREGKTKPWKKAIVSLAEGQRIELFPSA